MDPSDLPKGARRDLEEMIRAVVVSREKPDLQVFASSLVRGLKSVQELRRISCVHEFVLRKIENRLRTPGQHVAEPSVTLKSKMGDCAAKSALLATCLEAIGIEARFAVWTPPRDGAWGHAFVEAKIPRSKRPSLHGKFLHPDPAGFDWLPLDASVPSLAPGEPPLEGWNKALREDRVLGLRIPRPEECREPAWRRKLRRLLDIVR